MRIIVTGAGGFLGQAIVNAARSQNMQVRAIVRNTVPETWRTDPDITVQSCDLAQSADLDEIAAGDIVIHAAASLGDAAAQQRDTTEATQNLLKALPTGVRLVLVSSFSVYDYLALAPGAVLDEQSALEPHPEDRDAYARAKLDQEDTVRRAARERGLDLRIARPGVIYAKGARAWNALLGWKVGPLVVSLVPKGLIPAIHVEDCAAHLVELALRETIETGTVVNLVSPACPTRRNWIEAMGYRCIFLPQGLVFGGSKYLAALLPSGLRPRRLSARFKALTYDASLSQSLLGALPPRDLSASLEDVT